MQITISTQSQFNALPDSFKEFTTIYIENTKEWIYVNKTWENSRVEAWENSRVVARENSRVVARENSRVEAWENSRVVARENSRVVARGNSRVVARGNSRVVAWGNSRVEAWGNSRVEAWGNSRVEAWENSRVVARENNAIYLYSSTAHIILFFFAICFKFAKGKIERKSKTAIVVEPKIQPGVSGWLNANGIEDKSKVVLYKRVSKNFLTQEGTKNETHWKIGSTLEHQNWTPDESECGEGKFHACATPYFCDEFRDKSDDRYVAIEIAKKDLYAWENPAYPHKIAFRKGTVLYECDRFGEEIK